MGISQAIELALALLTNAIRVNQLIVSAQAEGRTDISPAELQAIVDGVEAARVKAIVAVS